MVYFIRRYQKGIKGSGTKDLLSSETEITVPMFIQLAEMTGPGKYILGQRGKGIRGFKKITDTIINSAEEMLVFAAEGEEESAKKDSESTEEAKSLDAETVAKAEAVAQVNVDPVSRSSEIKNSEDPSQIAVTASKSVEKMSDTELFETLGAMSQTRLEADNLSAFQADLLKLTAEMQTRGIVPGAENSGAEDKIIIGAGFSPMKAFAIGAIAGIGIGVIGSMTYYKRQIDDVNVKMAELEASIREAETTIGQQTRRIQRAEEEREETKAKKPNVNPADPYDLDFKFLSDYQTMQGGSRFAP
jgi:Sec-independent protein translocase protein TatA